MTPTGTQQQKKCHGLSSGATAHARKAINSQTMSVAVITKTKVPRLRAMNH